MSSKNGSDQNIRRLSMPSASETKHHPPQAKAYLTVLELIRAQGQAGANMSIDRRAGISEQRRAPVFRIVGVFTFSPRQTLQDHLTTFRRPEVSVTAVSLRRAMPMTDRAYLSQPAYPTMSSRCGTIACAIWCRRGIRHRRVQLVRPGIADGLPLGLLGQRGRYIQEHEELCVIGGHPSQESPLSSFFAALSPWTCTWERPLGARLRQR